MSNERVIALSISAFPDGANSYMVTIEEPATGRQQTIDVYALSEEDAIDRVCAILERNAKEAMGKAVRVQRGPLVME